MTTLRGATLAAVEAYNKPGWRFRTAQYSVLIVMEWTGALPRDLLQERAPTVAPQKDEGEGRSLREGGRRAEVRGLKRNYICMYI